MVEQTIQRDSVEVNMIGICILIQWCVISKDIQYDKM